MEETDPSALVVEDESTTTLESTARTTTTTTNTTAAAAAESPTAGTLAWLVESRRLRAARTPATTSTSIEASSAAPASDLVPARSAMEAAAAEDEVVVDDNDEDRPDDYDDDSNSLVAVPLGMDDSTDRRTDPQGVIASRSSGRENPSASSSSSVSFPSSNATHTTTANDDAPPAGDRGCRCLRNAFRLLFFPVFVVVSIAGLVLFLLFFCFPLLVFFLLLICVYYCCTDEPIPPRVLFRALWEDNTDTLGAVAANGGVNGAAQGASPYSVDEILANIVSRRLLHVSAISSSKGGGGASGENDSYGLGPAVVNVRNNPAYDGSVYLTDHDVTVLLHFSAPIVSTVTKEPSTEGNGTGPPVGDGGAEDTTDDHEGDGSGVRSSAADASTDVDVEMAEAAERQLRGWENAAASNDPAAALSTATATATATSTSAPSPGPHPLACDICLCEFEQGDVLSWSRNRRCQHHFHQDCIVDWLRRRTTCPSCRQEFVQP